jgi:exodeoxyribonuclease-3
MALFKIASFNTNSIRARLPIVLDWLTQEKPDVLCLQETKVQDPDFPKADFAAAGYQSVFKGQKSYNGVAILSRHPLQETSFYLSAPDEEARFIRAEVKEIQLINVYVPQGFEVGSEKFGYKLKWLENLRAWLQANYKPESPLLMMGDFNVALEAIDVYDPEKLKGEIGFHPEEQKRMRALLQWGLVDVLRLHKPQGGQYTFWDYRIPNAFKRNMGWRIDYILATPSLAKLSQTAWIDTEPRIVEKPSDHTFLIAEFKLPG